MSKFKLGTEKKMGAIVSVNLELERDWVPVAPPSGPLRLRPCPGGIVSWKVKPRSHRRAGWIVGERYLQEGRHIPSRGHGSEDFEQGRIEVSRIVPAYLVSYWPSMKPVLVPVNGFMESDKVEPMSPSKYSWLVTTTPEERDRWRHMLSTEMAGWPREANGRFRAYQP